MSRPATLHLDATHPSRVRVPRARAESPTTVLAQGCPRSGTNTVLPSNPEPEPAVEMDVNRVEVTGPIERDQITSDHLELSRIAPE